MHPGASMKAAVCSAFLLPSVAFGSFASNFNTVDPGTFDPKDTDLVAARWIHGIGCPTDQKITPDGSKTTPFSDPACPTGDKGDRDNSGLLLVKTGPTANVAAAGGGWEGGPGPQDPRLGVAHAPG